MPFASRLGALSCKLALPLFIAGLLSTPLLSVYFQLANGFQLLAFGQNMMYLNSDLSPNCLITTYHAVWKHEVVHDWMVMLIFVRVV